MSLLPTQTQIDSMAKASTFIVAIMLVCGLVANGVLIFYMINKLRKKVIVYDMQILSLSISDFAFMTLSATGVLRVTDKINQRSSVYQNGTFTCRLIFGILLYLTLVNMLVMASIAIYRYVTVLYPRISKKYLTVSATLLALIINWLLPSVFIVPPVVGVWGSFVYDNLTSSCTLELIPLGGDEEHHSSYSLFLILFGMTVPTTIMAACYIAIGLRLRQTSKRLKGHAKNESSNGTGTSAGTDSTVFSSQNSEHSANDTIPTISIASTNGQYLTVNPPPSYKAGRKGVTATKHQQINPCNSNAVKKERKITKIFGIIVVVYIISYFPYCTICLATILFNVQVSPLVFYSTIFFTYISSISNPFVFLAHNNKFKARLNKIFSKNTRRLIHNRISIRRSINRVIRIREFAH
ncbi:G-protein coupled receptor moody [Trichoplax sp. H2]|nr:G-protein coupled receptor moody [Trichoplax sp. H2]|eukprot:RDD46477.1 G-protein coupled receptor moody [Trichoplax sp. H2]